MLVLHGSTGSPFVARIAMQLIAKGVAFERKPAALGTPEFTKLNPINKMPVIEHDGVVVPESAIIAEYLEEAFPAPSLLPGSPAERARARLIARTVDLYCGSLLTLLRAFADPTFTTDVPAERAKLNHGLDALEAFLATDGHAAGPALSLADCTLVPWLYYGNKLTASGDDALTRRPKIARYVGFIGTVELPRTIWDQMDESFRAFMARWEAEQAAKQKG